MMVLGWADHGVEREVSRFLSVPVLKRVALQAGRCRSCYGEADPPELTGWVCLVLREMPELGMWC